ncbi:MAG TPA: hypothetical protein VMT36_05185, partial [Candidatus Saccharimonadia bacterium]|nr:hypothetical protein [Candidatus Saccharimonadia bacterium]
LEDEAPSGPPTGPLPESIVGWIAGGAIDSRLAAVVWLLAEGGVPLVVADLDAVAGRTLADALDAFGRPPVLLSAFPRSIEAASLQEVQARLAEPPFVLTEDAIRSVGVVLVLVELPDGRRRIRAAHYVRPLEQDPEGHVQRRPPALLAAWDAERDRLDDYAWGITAELAGRVGREPAAFERAMIERISLLDDLDRKGIVSSDAVASAILAASDAPQRTH